jgi:serine/threonine protein kinase/tetratricopeptide (TPR) repeat protein
MPERRAKPTLENRILAHYRVLAQLGRGGMGEVYLAEDLRLRRRVALKVLSSSLAGEPRSLERFQREARSVAALNHPNIVTLHSVEEAEGLHFLVMELVEGETLADLLATGPMSLERILEIALPLVEALEAIHARGVIHRDLKPRNVMVSREGRVKLLDFGIARLTQAAQEEDESSAETTLTKAGRIVGTTPYMSPEQLQGRPADRRSDLFSLGILLYEMATGQRPFRGKGQLSIAAAILYDTPSPPSTLRPGLPSRFDEIVTLCLAKEPFLRYKGATELRRDLLNLTAVEEPTLSGRPAVNLSSSSDTSSSSSANQRGTDPRLPARPRCFGRETEIRDLAESLCSDPPAPVPVLGPAGAGKTTMILAALHETRVAERFGRRRWFIRCDGASGRDSLAGAIARTLCPDAAPPLEPKVFNVLEEAPAVLALDNFETPWERETTEVEELLSELAAIPGLALAVALRGGQRPFGPSWREAIHAGPLDPESARNAFLAVAGERFQDDLDLDPLLLELDGLALAVVLLASQAEGEPDLSILRLRWQEQRTALLRRAGARERRQSLEVSLELSIDSPRMTGESRRLLSMVSLLPEGVAREDLAALLPGHGIEAASVLRKVGLAFDQGSRLRMLAPVREHVRLSHPPRAEDFERTIKHYLSLAGLGEKMGSEGGADVYRRLRPEVGNLEPMLLAGLDRADPLPAIHSALAYGWFLRFTGQGSPLILARARRAAQEAGEIGLEADCLRRQGDIAFSRSRTDEAEANFKLAQTLYGRVKDLHGEAGCMMLRGEIHLFLRASPEMARQYFEMAHSTFHALGDLSWEGQCLVGLGSAAVNLSEHKAGRTLLELARGILKASGDLRCEANCLQRMGQSSLEIGAFDQAQSEFEAALLLFRQVGSLLGEANCIRNLGHILFRRGDALAARPLLEKSLKLSRQAGSPIGEANCVLLLGEIASTLLEHERAETLLQQARLRFQRMGQLHEEGNATENLGINARAQSDMLKAHYWFRESLSLFQKIPQPTTVGRVHLQLARIAPPGSPERLEHVEAARQAWEEAGVLDQKRGELEAVAQAGPESA